MKRPLPLLRALVLILLLTAAADAAAQRTTRYVSDTWWAVTWSPAWGMSDTADYIGQWSWRGFGLEGRRRVRPDLTVGFSSGWTTLQDKAFRMQTEGTRTWTGVQNRYLNACPVLLNAHWYRGERRQRRFFLGLNAGLYWIERRTEVGAFALQWKAWHFGVAPEVGVLLPWGSNGWILNARWNHAFGTGSTPGEDWLTVGLGFRYH